MTKLEVYQIQDYYKNGVTIKEIAEKLGIKEIHVKKVIQGKAKEEICEECGKKFYRVTNNIITCSEECRNKRKLRQQKESYFPEKPVKRKRKKKITVSDFVKIAEEQGLTYAQLQMKETLGKLKR